MSKAIPKDWTLATLSDMAEIDPESLKSTTSDDFEFKYIDIASVSTGRIDLPSESIRFVDAPSRARRKVRAGDVLMSTVRPNLKAFAYFDKSINECIASTGFAVIRAKNGNVGRFIFNSIMSDGVSRQIDGLVVGSNYPAINSSDVRALEVLKPPIEEQQKIASILTAVDEMIASTTAQINKLKDLKTGMMQELLTKGIGHTEFKDSPVGRIPKVWSIKKLQDIAVVQSGVAKNGSLQGELIDVPYLRVANVQDGYLDLSEIKCISIERSRIERFLLKKDDVLVNEGGDFDKLGRGHIWDAQINPCLHQNHVFVVRANREFMLPLFFNYFSGSEIGKRYYLGCAKQTTNLASINSTQLKLMPIVLPPLVEQEQICTTLQAIDDKISALTNGIYRKKNLKKALMHDLLTGKVRV